MTRLLSKLLVATALLSGPARADTLTIGYWDQALGGGVTQLATSPGTPIQLLGNPLMLGTGFGFDQITTLLIPPSQSGLGGTEPTFEFAFNDGFVPPQGGTIRLYSTWQGAVTAGNRRRPSCSDAAQEWALQRHSISAALPHVLVTMVEGRVCRAPRERDQSRRPSQQRRIAALEN